MRHLVIRVIAIVIALAGLLAVAGYLSERGFRVTKAPAVGQQGQSGQRTAQSPAQSPTQSSTQSNDTRPHQGRVGTIDESQRGRGGRNVANKKSEVLVGTIPVPFFVNGRESGAVVGRELEAQLDEVTISSKHRVRTGWAMADILKAQGIQQAREVVFTNKAGQRLTTTWGQITDAQNRLIVVYGRNDTMLLFSGPELPPDQKLTRREAEELLPAGVDFVLFPDVVKIEVEA